MSLVHDDERAPCRRNKLSSALHMLRHRWLPIKWASKGSDGDEMCALEGVVVAQLQAVACDLQRVLVCNVDAAVGQVLNLGHAMIWHRKHTWTMGWRIDQASYNPKGFYNSTHWTRKALAGHQPHLHPRGTAANWKNEAISQESAKPHSVSRNGACNINGFYQANSVEHKTQVEIQVLA